MYDIIINSKNIIKKFYLGKHWAGNSLKSFTFPWISTRDQALAFCLNNNGTLMYWSNSSEQAILQGNFIFSSK
jgi:hypothetical protein